MRQFQIFLYGAWRLLLFGFLALIFLAQFVPEGVFVDYFRNPAVVEFLDDVEPYLDRSSRDREIELFERTFSKAFDRIMEDHVDPPDAAVLIDAALAGIVALPGAPNDLPPNRVADVSISAMLDALNTESSYATAEYAEARRRWTDSDSYVGIGVTVRLRDGFAQIIQLQFEGPAERAGMRRGDRITAIDGQAVQAWTWVGVIDRLRGDVDTDVIMTVRREGRADFDVSIRRRRLHHQTVQARLVDSIGYLRLFESGDGASNRFGESLSRLQDQAAPALDGIVLDLRGISGGALEEVVAIADMFLDQGLLIARTQGRPESSDFRHDAVSPDRTAGTPVVVLVGGGTAGLAQTLAGTLQAHGRAWILGTPTPGGAYIKTSYWLPNDAAVWISSRRVFTPWGQSLDQAGIEPDLHIADETETTPPRGRQVDPDRCPQRIGGSDKSIDCAIALIESGGVGRFLGELGN